MHYTYGGNMYRKVVIGTLYTGALEVQEGF